MKDKSPSSVKSDPLEEVRTLELEYVKHPLENSWSFWLFTNKIKNKWLENLRELTEFNTVEDYWRIYHYTWLPSELKSGQDYSVFKKGINPTWEDPANRAGGRWFLNMEKRTRELDRYWLDVVLLMIGENFRESNKDVCGAVVNVRDKGRHKISLWTRSTNEQTNMEIGRIIKAQLSVKFRLHFYAHNSNNALY